jgi:nitroimidazol reductase NimA-like FMN-containing flavoprotein (pyridoxamine 5'-phosphate oxidase superfamily)
MVGPMSEEESRELLRRGRVARLGVVLNNEAYVVPVYYLWHGDAIYIHSRPGRKIWALRANPRACIQVDEVKDEYHWRSVIAVGAYEEITESRERERILSTFLSRFPHLTPVEAAHPESKTLGEVIVFRVKVDRLTGAAEGY